MNINQENKELLALFDDFRVADVRDGMDWIGYRGFGTMEAGIRPLHRTKVVGIARTARYLPFAGPYPDAKNDEYTKWMGWYYSEVCPYPWVEDIQEGSLWLLT